MGGSDLPDTCRKPYRGRSRIEKAEDPPEKTVLRLEAASPLQGWAIKVAGRGTSRQARDQEAAALLIGALATVAESTSSGVKTLNLTGSNGQPLALAIIENARFGKKHGETTLSPVVKAEG